MQLIQRAVYSWKLTVSELDSHIITLYVAGIGKSGINDDKNPKHHDQTRSDFKRCRTIAGVRLIRHTTSGMGKGIDDANFDFSDAV